MGMSPPLLAGTDDVASSGTLSWLDGDTAPKTFPVTLSNPRYGSLGTAPSETVTLN